MEKKIIMLLIGVNRCRSLWCVNLHLLHCTFKEASIRIFLIFLVRKRSQHFQSPLQSKLMVEKNFMDLSKSLLIILVICILISIIIFFFFIIAIAVS